MDKKLKFDLKEIERKLNLEINYEPSFKSFDQIKLNREIEKGEKLLLEIFNKR